MAQDRLLSARFRRGCFEASIRVGQKGVHVQCRQKAQKKDAQAQASETPATHEVRPSQRVILTIRTTG